MEERLRTVVTTALQKCRQDGCKADVVQLAYTACLLEEAAAWGTAPTAAAAQRQQPPQQQEQSPEQQQQQQQEQLSLAGFAKLTDAAAALMADRLAQEVAQPADPAAASTADLQIALARAFQEQQSRVEAEQAASAAEAARLAAAVAYKKVNLAAVGLPEYQKVFEQVVDYVAAAIGLAAKAAADAAARAGVAAAVESAFPLSGVAHFLTLPPAERMQQMEALARVTCGICLFNDSQGEAAALVPPAPSAHLQHSRHLLEAIEAATATAEQAMAHYNSLTISSSSSSSAGSSSSGGAGALGAALFCCQAVAVMRQLAADLAGGISCCQALEGGLEATLLQVERHVGGSPAAVPKEAVFPLFDSAGQLHLALAGELRLLLVRARLWEATTSALAAAAAAHPSVPNVLQFKGRLGGYGSSSSRRGMPGSAAALSEAEAAELPAGMEFVVLPGAGASGSSSNSASDEQSRLALAGFCPVSLASSAAAEPQPAEPQPAVLVGRLAEPSVGCIRYQGALFGFCSAAALRSFVAAPGPTLAGVRQAVARAPLLAHLLGLSAGTAAGAAGGGAGHGSSQGHDNKQRGVAGLGSGVPPLRQLLALLAAPVRVDASTQTPTHFCDRLVDVDYEWNEWALRRRVIALANLRNKATHGAQTLLSHFRRDGGSQTWALKTASAQTPVNSSSAMPRKLRYVTGLRGPPTTKMKVVSLELDIGQTHQH